MNELDRTRKDYFTSFKLRNTKNNIELTLAESQDTRSHSTTTDKYLKMRIIYVVIVSRFISER